MIIREIIKPYADAILKSNSNKDIINASYEYLTDFLIVSSTILKYGCDSVEEKQKRKFLKYCTETITYCELLMSEVFQDKNSENFRLHEYNSLERIIRIDTNFNIHILISSINNFADYEYLLIQNKLYSHEDFNNGLSDKIKAEMINKCEILMDNIYKIIRSSTEENKWCDYISFEKIEEYVDYKLL